MAPPQSKSSRREVSALVAQLMAWRADYVRAFLVDAGVPFKQSLSKGGLRERIHEAIADGELTVADIASHLDEIEPGNKQHVFLMKAQRAFTNGWSSLDNAKHSLSRRAITKPYFRSQTPLLVPGALTLASIDVTNSELVVTAVESREYPERNASLDKDPEFVDGVEVEFHAWVHRIARTTVTFRWNLGSGWASLHVTKATGRGEERDHYEKRLQAFGALIREWLDLSNFDRMRLQPVIEKLRELERDTSKTSLTRTPRGRWDTADGSAIEATSPDSKTSLYGDRVADRAIGQVAGASSGSTANLWWLDLPASFTDLDDVHLTILAGSSRVHFMVPTSGEVVDHVLDTLRSLR